MQVNYPKEIDILIFSGVEFDSKVLFKDNFEGLKGKFYDREVKKFTTELKNYKESLNFTLGKICTYVRAHFKKFQGYPEDHTSQVSTKIKELADIRIKKEDKFNSIHKFFHKIGQFFQGHGFRTEGKWGLSVANDLIERKVDLKSLGKQLDGYSGIGDVEKQLHLLTDNQFRKFLPKFLDTLQKKRMAFHELNDLFATLDNKEKKEIFIKTILERSDWFTLCCSCMLSGYKNEKESEVKAEKEFIAMLPMDRMGKLFTDKFSSHGNDFKNQEILKNAIVGLRSKKFVQYIVEKSIIENLEKENIQNVKHAINRYHSNIVPKMLVEERLLLTEQQFQKIKNNIIPCWKSWEEIETEVKKNKSKQTEL